MRIYPKILIKKRPLLLFNVIMNKQKNYIKITQEIFQPYSDVTISDELAETIEANLVSLFELLISWDAEKEANQM